MSKPSLQERVLASHGVTQVEVHIRPSQSRYDRYWVLELTCPFCHRPHQHGGGALSHPPALGSRLSHCVSRSPRDYELISSIKEEVEI